MSVLATPRYRRFWRAYATGGWEPETTAVLDLLKPGDLYIDIGAWIGPTALYAATLGASVVAIEPDEMALKELRANIRENPLLAPRVEVVDAAISNRTGIATLHGDEFGNSESTLVATTVARRDRLVAMGNSQECRTLSVEDAVEQYNLRSAALIKIDIEGGEYDILPTLATLLRGSDAVLLISFHPFNLGNNLPPSESAAFRRRHTDACIAALADYEVSSLDGEKNADLSNATGAYLFQPR